MWYLRLLYRLYPASELIAEYRHALHIVERYGCRRVLDVGCGFGALARVLLRRAPVELYVGLDLAAAPRPRDARADFLLADARLPPLPRRPGFDCALFVNSLFYIGLEALRLYTELARYAVVIDIDPRYPHVRLVDALESRGRGMRLSRRRLVEALSGEYRVVEEGGAATYYVVLQPR